MVIDICYVFMFTNVFPGQRRCDALHEDEHDECKRCHDDKAGAREGGQGQRVESVEYDPRDHHAGGLYRCCERKHRPWGIMGNVFFIYIF